MLICHKSTLLNYYLFVMVDEQGTFLPLIVPPTIYQAGLWSTWLIVLCSFKVYIILNKNIWDNCVDICCTLTKLMFINMFWHMVYILCRCFKL